MSNRDVVIVDYGLGNLFNVQRAFEFLGGVATISSDPKVVLEAPRLFLPGVGAFGEGMKYLHERNLVDAIVKFVKSGKSLIGVCLGAQLLLSESEEYGRHEGLNFVSGRVVRFKDPTNGQEPFKIPHIGWSSLQHSNQDEQRSELLSGIANKSFVYFVHSYVMVPDNQTHSLAITEYGNDRFCSIVGKDNIIGCQFHPERSGEIGLKLLKNFLNQN